MSYILF